MYSHLSGTPTFYSFAAAREHCPDDTIVWAESWKKTFYYEGHRRYARTQWGNFACLEDVRKAGYQANNSSEQ